MFPLALIPAPPIERNKYVKHKAKQYLSATVEYMREGLVTGPLADLKLTIRWSITIDNDIASDIIQVAEDGENTEGTGAFDGSDLIAMATTILSQAREVLNSFLLHPQEAAHGTRCLRPGNSQPKSRHHGARRCACKS